MNITGDAYGIVILAAGGSSRLGQPKQLLKFEGKSLIWRTADEAVKATGNKVIVVTGANKGLVEKELAHLPVHVIYNQYWQEGISSSIYTGIITLIKIFPQLDAIIFSVCDQPFISAGLFKKMIEMQQQKKKA
jgi:molybdenum cofactor cytidylyltransferase